MPTALSGDWMYRVMAGIDIDPAAPGYKHILIAAAARRRFHERQGVARIAVRQGRIGMDASMARAFTLAVDVPPNTHATIRLPGAKGAAVTLDGRSLVTGDGVTNVTQAGTDVVVEVGSGHYLFGYTMAPAGS